MNTVLARMDPFAEKETTRNVLVIDDSPSIRRMVQITLGGRGYNLSECEDGVEALFLIARFHVDLIICDVNMPNMDGITFLRRLRMQGRHRFTPVIMLTTECSSEQKSRGLEAGARAWIIKPFEAEQLVSAVSRLIV